MVESASGSMTFEEVSFEPVSVCICVCLRKYSIFLSKVATPLYQLGLSVLGF